MKTLLLDIGNSRIKWGIHEGGAVHQTGRMQHSVVREQGFSELTSRLPWANAVFVCNVAGERFSALLSKAIGAQFDCEPRFVRSELQAYGVRNGYRMPTELGADRWVAMIAARAMCEASCVVVDAGTAITIDALSDDGQHLGGQILPGLGLMTDSLASSTNDLPNLNWRESNNYNNSGVLARDTRAAISLGVIGAAVGVVERSTRSLRKAGLDPTVIVTGGDVQHILRYFEEKIIHRPHLILEGLARIVENKSA